MSWLSGLFDATRRLLSTLRVRLLLLVLLAAGPPIAIALKTTAEWRMHEARESTTQAERLAQVLARNEQRLLDSVRDGLAMLAELPVERWRDRAQCRRELSAGWHQSVRYETLGVVGTDGRLLCATAASDEQDDWAARPYVREAAEQRSYAIGDDRIDPATGRCTLGFALPLLDRAARLRAIVFAIVDVAGLDRTITPVTLPRGATFTLLDHDGTILARYPDARRWVGKSALATPAFRRVLAQQREPAADAVDLDGLSRVFAFEPVPGLPPDARIVVAVGLTPDQDFADSGRFLAWSELLVALAGALALAVTWIGANVMGVRRGPPLAAGARRLSPGAPSLCTIVRRGSAELCPVACDLDEMAARLQRRHLETEQVKAALRASRAELESRVRAGTAALATTHEAFQTALAERQRAEQALRQLSSAVEQAADSIMIASRDGVVEYVNPAFTRLTGYTAEEAVGRTSRILKSGMHDDEFYRGLWRTIVAGDVFRAVFVNRKKCGELYYEEKTIAPLRNERGEITHFVSAGRDITESKLAEEQLRSSREQLRALAAHLESVREDERCRIAREIHDELGHALTGLKFEACRLAAIPPDHRAEVAETANGMVGLIDATIDSVRRIAKKLRPGVLDDFGLLAAIEWQAEEFQAHTGIRCRFSAHPAEMELDRDLSTAVFRILQETLSNVARHANATQVEVTLTLVADTLRLTVADNGRGITPAELVDGRSLGLLGMRERAHLLGGRLTVTGRPGDGTTVVLDTPVPQRATA
jgi:PAS domain S-box-containing protein